MSPERRAFDSETNYRRLFNAVADAIFTLDPETGIILDANENARKLYGWELGDLRGMPMTSLSAEPEETEASIRRVILSGRIRETRRHKRRDGSVFHAEISASAFESGGRRTAIAAIRDVTEARDAEEALRESRSLLEQAQEVARTGSWSYDVRADVVLWSRECCRILGVEPSWPRRVADFIAVLHPDDRERVKALVAAALESGDDYEAEYRVGGEGAPRRVLSRGTITRDEYGRPLKMIGVVRDVTAERDGAERLASTELQLRQAQKMEAVGRLAGGVAHDFNNILTAILGLTELSIMALPEDSPVRVDLAEVKVSALRAANLTHQLLAFSRRQPITPKVVDLDGAILGVSRMLQRIIGEDVELSVAPGSGAAVLVDPGQLEQLAANLAVNARDAMPEGGRLTISTGTALLDARAAALHDGLAPGEYATLVVADDGCGMSEEVKSHLFEPFFTTKALGKGTGLGLATCYGIARQNLGAISCESAPGRGTSFTVYLPRHPIADVEAADAQEAASSRRGTERVLVVEDEKAVRELVIRVLGSLGYDVLRAQDGAQALAILREDVDSAVRLVVTDMIMPEIGGKKLGEIIAAVRPDVRVLFTSGYTDDTLGRPEAGDPGIDFLAKPFSAAQLGARVRAALDAPPPPRGR